MDQSNANNHVILTGIVHGPLIYSHSLYGEAFYSTEIETPRLSGVVDVLPMTVSERLLQQTPLKPGQCIHVEGQLRSYNKYVEGNNRLILTVFVQTMNLSSDPPANRISICGFICKPPVYRTTPFHREIADLLLAVNRAFNKSDYIPCIAWGRNARFAQDLTIGSRVNATGRVQSREYQKTLENGETIVRVAYEVSISTLGHTQTPIITS